jgi:hypothetical protein
MPTPATPATKLVPRFTMICDHPDCHRRVHQLEGRSFTRLTTCKRHMPEGGYIVQVSAEYEAKS